MRKLFVILSLFVTFSHATLTGSGFVQNDLKILEELDIDSSYISDYKLQRYYKRFTQDYTSRYADHLDNAQLFIPQIKTILRENKIPSAFLFLAMAESNFVLDAASHKKAKGIWQFIPQTAEVYGLKTNKYIDERMDLIKSTNAAVSYLQRLYSMFGKWYLAAIAYNCGEARVIEGITRATLDMYCEDNNCKKDPKIQEFRDIIKDYQQKKIPFSKVYQVYKKVKEWDYKPGIDELLIEQNNLSRQYIPQESRNYIRKIISLAMMNNSDYLLLNENNHLLNSGLSSPVTTVSIKGGVLLKNIADVIKISKKELQELNPHMKKNMTPPDDGEYNIHIPYSKLALFYQNIGAMKPNQFESYTVKRGDSLGKIAAQFDIDYKLIKKYNNLQSNVIAINQELVIPIDPETYKRPKDYFVKKGDTLYEIAKFFDIPLQKLMSDNNLKSGNIQIGEKIVVKFK